MDTIGQAVATISKHMGSGQKLLFPRIPMTGRPYPVRHDGKVPLRELVAKGLLERLLCLAASRIDTALNVRGWPLYLYGDTGVGKTCAAKWMLNQVPKSAYLTHFGLRQRAYLPEALIWTIARTYNLVVIDEVGTASQEEDGYGWKREKDAVKRFADQRGGRATIWLSNKSAEELLQLYDDRIHSRLCSGTVVHLTGPDRRFE